MKRSSVVYGSGARGSTSFRQVSRLCLMKAYVAFGWKSLSTRNLTMGDVSPIQDEDANPDVDEKVATAMKTQLRKEVMSCAPRGEAGAGYAGTRATKLKRSSEPTAP